MKKTIVSLLLVFSIFISFSSSFAVEGSNYEDPTEDYEPIIAEHEDSNINMWFEHPYNKVQPTNITSSRKNTFLINMAKNEIEGAQFILYSAQAKTGLTAEISDFEDEQGNVLVPELFYEYYSKSFSGLMPDAIPPLVDSFDLTAGKSKAFYYKVTTEQDTPAGLYTANLIIRDEQGKEIKKAEIYLRVWNVVLSEETASKTAIMMDYNAIERTHKNAGSTKTGKELYTIYYEYLLENRINAFHMPSSITERNNDAAVWMNNPRVTCFAVCPNFGYPADVPITNEQLTFAYNKIKDNPLWLDKAYFYSVDEPGDKVKVDLIISESARIKTYFPDAQIMIPQHLNYQYDANTDYTEKIKDSVDIWCPKTNALTERTLNAPGASYMTTAAQDAKYGSFKSRMEAEVAKGKKLWWYVASDPDYPYAQIMLDSTLISARIMFWQQKMYEVEGFLYYWINEWTSDKNNPSSSYWDLKPYYLGNTNTILEYGNGLLIYDGAKVGIEGPVGSLRLESMRDGIEDFQLLTMYQEKYNKNSTDNLISNVSQHVATYNADGDNFAATKIALLESLEVTPCPDGEHQGGQATCLSKAICEICGSAYGELGDHTYQAQNINYITQADCTNDGTAEVKCEVCYETISLSIPALGHSLNDKGQCTREGCQYAEYYVGDLNYDKIIDDIDDMLMTRYLAQWDVEINEYAADVNLDNELDDIDSMYLARYLAQWENPEDCFINEFKNNGM